jgi:hypothetical protein
LHDIRQLSARNPTLASAAPTERITNYGMLAGIVANATRHVNDDQTGFRINKWLVRMRSSMRDIHKACLTMHDSADEAQGCIRCTLVMAPLMPRRPMASSGGAIMAAAWQLQIPPHVLLMATSYVGHRCS